MKTVLLMLVAALTLFGADVTGKWTGTVEITDPTSGEKMAVPVHAEFAQKAGEVAGTIGREQDTDVETIHEGKTDGKNLTFEARPADATSAFKFKLVLVSDDRIEGDVQGAVDTGNIAGKVVLTRVK